MDFSEAYKYAGPRPVFSPDGKYVACAVDVRCVIRDCESLTVSSIFSCADKLDAVSWSPSGAHVLCAMHSRSLVQIWSVEEESWSCKIDGGPSGIASALWTSTGAGVLTVSDFNLRLTSWDLRGRSCQQHAGPKHSAAAIRFSRDGHLLAVAERGTTIGLGMQRANLKDYVAIYHQNEPDGDPTRFRVATSDLADLAWSPDGSMLAAWDSALAYKVAVYKPDGACVGTYQAYDGALGIRCVAWSPDSQMLAIGSYDQALRIVSKVNWKPLATLEHPESLAEEGVVGFEEVRDGHGGANGEACSSDDEGEPAEGQENSSAPSSRRRYAVCEKPVSIPKTKPDASKANPAVGISTAAFSATGRYIASFNESQAKAVWVWDVQALCLACVLLHEQAVKHVAWDPVDDKLAICTGSRRLHLWTPDGASCVHVPLSNLKTCHLSWKADGSAAIVSDRDRFCVGYVA